jgi:hypothetical protein
MCLYWSHIFFLESDMRFSSSDFFHESVSPGLLSIPFRIFTKIRRDKTGDNLSPVTTKSAMKQLQRHACLPQNEHNVKIITATQQHLNKVRKTFLSQIFSHLYPVLLTPVINLYFRISPLPSRIALLRPHRSPYLA